MAVQGRSLQCALGPAQAGFHESENHSVIQAWHPIPRVANPRRPCAESPQALCCFPLGTQVYSKDSAEYGV